MNRLDKVTATFQDLEHMTHPQALFLRDFIAQRDLRDILEVGFNHGKGSAYLAAILEDLGRGHLVTIDREGARAREPNIERVLTSLGLSHRVTPVFAQRSYTWEMGKMIRSRPRPQFDLCYFDAGHTWDETGFGFVLVDMLLRPGGWIIFDDLPWTIDAAMSRGGKVAKRWRTCSEDERTTPGVRLVFELLVPHLGYTDIGTALDGWWGIARKPLHRAAAQPREAKRGALTRVREVLARR